MTDIEILEKHGKDKCEFYNSYKYSFIYVDVDGEFKIYGTADYRSEFNKIMSVSELWNELQTFNFELINIDNR